MTPQLVAGILIGAAFFLIVGTYAIGEIAYRYDGMPE